MDPDRHQELSDLFDKARAMLEPERQRFVNDACGDDLDLRTALMELLKADQETSPITEVGFADPISDPPTPQAGAVLPERIGEYRILGILGEGGMGTVFDAEQDHPRRKVALKILRAVSPSQDLRRRFALESELLGRLQHPGIASIHAAGYAQTAIGPQPFFAMEKVEGERLNRWATSEQPTPREVAALIATIADAVHHAHMNGVIHRDLKPANILVDGSGMPRILDFGIARASDGEGAQSSNTRSGALLGTLPYMSPEQATGDPTAVDQRCDIYSLGCVAYELLCGKLPVSVKDTPITQALQKIEHQEPTRLHRQASIDTDLDAVVHMALAKEKDRRYPSAAAFAEDLRRFLARVPVQAKPLTLGYQLRKLAARRPYVTFTVSAVAVAFVVGLIGTTTLWRKAEAHSREIQGLTEDITREASRRARVHDFLLEDLLRAPDPWRHGRDSRVVDQLRRASETVGEAFADEPELEAEVRVTLGRTFRNLGSYGEAETHFARAAQLRRDIFGDEAELTLDAVQHLSHVWWDLERIDEAQAIAIDAFETSKRTLGLDHSATLSFAHRLGLIAQSMRQVDEAIQWFIFERDGLLRQHGPDDIRTLRAAGNLELAYLTSRDLERAGPLINDTLARRRRTLGEDHPDTLISLGRLAALREEQGRQEDAIPIFRQAYSRMKDVLGPESQYTANCAKELANALINEDEFSEALRVLDEALAQYGASEDAIPKLMTRLTNTRGTALEHLGRLDEALEAFLESLALRKKAYGDRSADVATALNNLGAFHANNGNHESALDYLAQALSIRIEVLGPDHPELVTSYSNVAQFSMSLGELDKALSQLRNALRIEEATHPNDGRMKAAVLTHLGDCLTRLEQWDEAKPVLKRAEKMIPAVFDPEHGSRRYLESRLRLAQSRLTDAEDYGGKDDE